MSFFNMKSPMPQVVLLILLVFFSDPATTLAIDIGDKVQFHGFITQGYLNSDDNNFLGNTKDGTFRMTEIGLNLNAQITDKFRLGGQALYCHPPGSDKGEISADWLVAEYHFSDPLGTRIGKIKMPMGLYNMERDSDFLRPLIFLPQSIYDETRRDSWQAHWGAEIYGNLPINSKGDLDYQLFGGRIEYDGTLSGMGTAVIVERYNMKNSTTLGSRDLSRENNYVYGAALFYNSSIEGLRGALTFLSLEDETLLQDNTVIRLKVKSKFIASIEYNWQQFSIVAEYSETDRTQEQFGMTTLDGTSQAWYILLGYSPIEDVTFSILYDEYYRLKSSRHDPAGPYNLYPWRKDLAAAVRYDISENWTAKAEWHTIDGTAFYMNFFNPDGAEQYWQYGALKLSFNF